MSGSNRVKYSSALSLAHFRDALNELHDNGMFIPYHNGHLKGDPDVIPPSPNYDSQVSGNFGRGPNAQGAQLYDQLASDALQDQLWTQDDLNEDTKIIHGGTLGPNYQKKLFWVLKVTKNFYFVY